jgi:hypothetical protein
VITFRRTAEPAVEPILMDDVLMDWTGVSIGDTAGTPNAAAKERIRELITDQRQFLENDLERAMIIGPCVATLDLEDLIDWSRDQEGYRRHYHTLPGVWRQGFMQLLRREVYLPLPPLVSVQSVTATLVDGTTVLMDPTTDYWVALAGEDPGRILLRDGVLWPSPLRRQACLEVQFTGGYAAAIGPAVQAITDTETPIAASVVAAAATSAVRYAVEVAGNNITWTVYGANNADWSDEAPVHATDVVTDGRMDHVTIPALVKAYYRVKIKSQVAGSGGLVTLTGIAGVVPGPLRVAVRELVRYHYVHTGDQLYIGAGGFKGTVPPPDAILAKVANYRRQVVV